MAYLGRSNTGFGIRDKFQFTAAGSETTVSGSDDNSRTLKFSDGKYVDVYLNGVLLSANTDYNTTTANTIGGLVALAANDLMEIVSYDIFSIADVVPATGGTFSGNVAFVGDTSIGGNQTVTGDLTVTGNLIGDIEITGTTPKLTIGDAGTEDSTLLFDGNAQDFYVALDDSADDLVIGLGAAVGTTPAISIDSDQLVTTHAGITMVGTTPTLTIGDAGAEDTKIVFDGNAADFHVGLDDTDDKLKIGLGSALGTTPILTVADGSLLLSGTTPTLTIGDAGAEDTKIVFDGNAQDFYVGLDDSADDLVIGFGSTVGTTPAISVDQNQLTTIHADMLIGGATPTLTIGDAGAEDTKIVFDGNAQDFYIALDDSADDLLIGLGSAVGTTPAIAIDENLKVTTFGDITMTGTTPVLTIGDAGAEDTAIVFDGNAQDFYIGLDDSADDLVIGLGAAVGTTPAISITEALKTQFGGAAVAKTITDATNTGNVTLDYDAGQNFVLTFTGNVTLVNPSTESVGQTGIIVIIQDGTGSRTLSVGTDYEFPAGTAPTISTGANTTDIIPYCVIAANRVALGAPQLAFA